MTIRKTNRTKTGTCSSPVPILWLSPEACEAVRNMMSTDVTTLTAVTMPHRTLSLSLMNFSWITSPLDSNAKYLLAQISRHVWISQYVNSLDINVCSDICAFLGILSVIPVKRMNVAGGHQISIVLVPSVCHSAVQVSKQGAFWVWSQHTWHLLAKSI